MNPDTNRFEPLAPSSDGTRLLRPDGRPVPGHWARFTVGDLVDLRGHGFRVAYIGETAILLEPTGPVLVGEPRRQPDGHTEHGVLGRLEELMKPR